MMSTKKTISILIIIVLSIILITFIVYKCNFPGSFSKEHYVWGDFGDYFGGVIATFMGSISLIIALYALYRTINKEKFNDIFYFMKDYRSTVMSKDLKLLWDFYNKSKLKGEKKKEDLKKRYSREHKKSKEIYYSRRNIAHFYLQLSLFIKNNEVDDNLLFSIWNRDVLKIIDEIIIPCEESIEGITGNNTKIEPFLYLIQRCQKYEQKKLKERK